MFLLVDCNNFFVSCERIFQPKLKDKPVVVLSNNDGCVIARSNEAKKMGIKMGDPFFLHKTLFQEKKLFAFSSNFALYGDMAERIRQILERYPFSIEVYSIDEAFLFTPKNNPEELLALAKDIRHTILTWTGIPVSIGIAPTKTLAKLTSDLAKKEPTGLYYLQEPQHIDALLAKTAVEDIWGIGSKLTEKLKTKRIFSAKDLKDADKAELKKHFNVLVEKTAIELQGHPCLDIVEIPPSNLSITTSRSFASPLQTMEALKEALASFVAIAAKKLRKQKSVAGAISFYVSSSFFEKNENNFYSNSFQMSLSPPTNYTADLLLYAEKALLSIFRQGVQYKKAGVLLYDLAGEDSFQQDLFAEPGDFEKKRNLSHTLDRINQKYQKKSLYFASEGIKTPWAKIPLLRSPDYTRNWEEILSIK